MTKIAHASGDERRKLSGGKAGDQTGKEVCIREWYNRPWNCVLHWKDPIMAERCAYVMERGCRNDKIGYDQSQRNTALVQARKVGYDMGKITEPCETDCSAMLTIACIYAGIQEAALYKNGNSATTSTLRARLVATGAVIVRTADKYTKSPDYNVRGDILLYEGHHVAVQIENGKNVKAKAEQYIPDISHYHPVNDWAAVKESCPVIFSKATQGTEFVDSTLKDFVKGCEQYNIPYWLYTYLNRGNELAQTKFLVETCKDLVGNNFIGYILDVEANNKPENVRKAYDWLAKRYRAMIYTGYSDYSKYKEIVLEIPLWWEARYGKNDGFFNAAYPCHSGADLHQYTSLGYCPGITGKADLNRIVNGTIKDFIDHMPAPVPEPTPEPGKPYSGKFPVFAPGRDCYKYGDGITTLLNYPTQIRRVQQLINWINTGDTIYSARTAGSIAVDGKYGKNTVEAVKRAQKVIGANVDGIFGTQTLRLAKQYKR